ncbi:MAG: HD domain-containing phosphohydrolase [Gallionella sp.]|jgi:PAS domain S-box-containing protein
MVDKPSKPESLRAEAEARLTGAPLLQTQLRSAEDLLHELQVSQIELEMQNEELRRAHLALEKSRDRYAGLYEFAPAGYLTLTRAGQISEINLTGTTLLGLERNKLLQRRFDHFIVPEDRDRWHLAFVRAIEHTGKTGIELKLLRGDGSTFHAHLDCMHTEDTGPTAEVRMAVTDISAMELNKQLLAAQNDLREQLALLKRKDAALMASEERLRMATQTARDAIVVIEAKSGTITEWNSAAEAIFGYTQAEALGQVLHDLLTPPRLREAAQHGLAHFALSGEGAAVGKTLELLALHKDGTEFPIELSLSAMQLHEKWYATGIARDISARKQSEIALEHANRALATLGVVNRQLVYASSEDELLHAICQAIVEQRGYRMASVGYAQQDADKTVKIMAYSGQNGDYLDTMQLTWAETERGMEPTGRAIRSGATKVCQDIASDPYYLPWRDAALQRSFASSITLPLLDADKIVFGALTVYSDEVNTFIPGEIALLEEMAGDLAFGVRTLHMRQERDRALKQNQQYLVQLQHSLENTVQAIGTIVEMRDPYTAGHQRRVADLAMAIAKQMALPDEHVHAIHLAGIVHDLGKIQIPSEILSKPGKLSAIEYELIKIHPQAGYEILKGIDFPWPIAQMVLQHHERIDGSGYPQGLKGDAIMLEALILGVADVVEAIASHRPYRAAMGMAAALSEIEQSSGLHYDPAVVAACIKVVRDNDMRLPE